MVVPRLPAFPGDPPGPAVVREVARLLAADLKAMQKERPRPSILHYAFGQFSIPLSTTLVEPLQRLNSVTAFNGVSIYSSSLFGDQLFGAVLWMRSEAA